MNKINSWIIQFDEYIMQTKGVILFIAEIKYVNIKLQYQKNINKKITRFDTQSK